MFGDLIASSGSLALPSTNGFNAPEFIFGNANHVIGAEVSFFAGGGASILNSARVIEAATPYSAASASLYGIVRVLPPWAVAPSTNSSWEVHKLFTRAQYDDALSHAIRRVAKRMLQPAEEFVVARAGLRNAAFDYWGSGTSSAPTGWTLGGTGATVSQQVTIVPMPHRFSAALVSDGTNTATLTQTARNIGQYAGKTVTLRALVYTTTAARVFIRLNDGSTNFDSSNHAGVSGGTGDGQWLELTSEVALGTGITTLAASLQISSGSAVTAYIAKMWIDGITEWEYPIEWPFASIQDVLLKDTDNAWKPLPREWWYVNRAPSPRRIGFMKDWYNPSGGYLLKLVGQQYPTDVGEETNLPVDPEYMRNRAAADLFLTLPQGSADWKGHAGQARTWELRADELERRNATRIYQGSKLVEDI